MTDKTAMTITYLVEQLTAIHATRNEHDLAHYSIVGAASVHLDPALFRGMVDNAISSIKARRVREQEQAEKSANPTN